MSRLIAILLLALSTGLLQAQTIIELKKGGNVRAKTVDDYRTDRGMSERNRQDSITYVDHLRRAFNALHTDSLDEADRRFHAALKLRPDAPGNYIVYYNLALIDLSKGRGSQAVKQLTDIINTHPDYYAARLARAEANLQLAHCKEAISDAETLLSQPELKRISTDILWRARFVRAAARYELRLYPDARADLQQLLRERPASENARILEALTLQRMGQPNEALNRLNIIVASNPQSIDALTTRAAVLAELGKPALARADYDALIALQPNESAHYIERARMLVRTGDKSGARRDLDRAISLGVPRGVVQSLYNLTK